MTYLILGGSSGLGSALARQFAANGHELILVSQDERDTEALASHLHLTHDVKVTAVQLDLSQPLSSYAKIDGALQEHTSLHGILVPVGMNDIEDKVGLSDRTLERITYANFLSPVMLINHFLPEIRTNGGNIAGFGSVATARGRGKNAAYASAKRALESYFESLAQQSDLLGISVQFYTLGYLDTNLAFSENLMFPRGKPSRLAQLVYQNAPRKTGKFLFPRFWWIIVTVVRLLPWAIFKRLSF